MRRPTSKPLWTKKGWCSLIEVMREREETEETLATKLGVRPRTIRAYMYGEVVVSLERFEQLVFALGSEYEERLRRDYPRKTQATNTPTV